MFEAIVKIFVGFFIITVTHELGHAIAAILSGVKVCRFGIGFGPGLTIRRVPKFNEVVISPLLIGGYVSLDDQDFEDASFFRKQFILVSGMIANVLTASVLLLISGTSFVKAITMPITVWLFGWPMFVGTFMNKTVSASDVIGPIGISHLMTSGEHPYLLIVAFISSAVAMFNLLPIPPLDGGHMFMTLLEKIWGRKLVALNKILSAIGMIAIFALVIFATVKDVQNLLF